MDDDNDASDSELDDEFCDMPEDKDPPPKPHINRLALLANVVLVLGFAFNLWFQYYEFVRRDREIVAIVVYFAAFALLILAGIMELCIDALSVRTVGHGRYHADSALWNGVISLLFVSAGLLDIVSFIFWMEGKKGEERKVLLISAYVFFIAATLALTFNVLEAKKVSWPGTIKPDRIDLMANGLFFVTAVLGVVLRHIQFSQMGFDGATNEMELIIVPLFLFCSILFVIADGHRWNMKED
jgi:hypothetical protein